MKTIRLLVLLAPLCCDESAMPPDNEGAASGKADDPALLCAENTPSPLDGRSIEDMERTGTEPSVIAEEDDVIALEGAGAKPLLEQLQMTAEHFGREDVRDLVATSDLGVSVGQMAYSDIEFDIILFFEHEESHGLAFLAGTLDPVGEIGINYDIVGCKLR
jgi:hypothetical protein